MVSDEKLKFLNEHLDLRMGACRPTIKCVDCPYDSEGNGCIVRLREDVFDAFKELAERRAKDGKQ